MKQNKTFLLCITALFTALLCICSQISITIGPVPINLAVFAVFLSGALLPPVYAFSGGLAYLLLGGIGLPVFAGMNGGISALIGPTGGYLVAYPLMAWAFSMVRKEATMISYIIGVLISLLICYGLGTVYFSQLSGMSITESLAVCVIPFILPDLGKAFFAIWFADVLRRRTKIF